MRTQAAWQVNLFGDLCVLRRERETQVTIAVRHFRTQRSALLLSRLAIQPGRAFAREELGEMLWPEEQPQLQRNRLRYELTMLRSALGADLLVSSGQQSVALAPEVGSDVVAFDKGLRAVVRATSAETRLPLLREALHLYQDDLLVGLYLPEGVPPEYDWLALCK